MVALPEDEIMPLDGPECLRDHGVVLSQDHIERLATEWAKTRRTAAAYMVQTYKWKLRAQIVATLWALSWALAGLVWSVTR